MGRYWGVAVLCMVAMQGAVAAPGAPPVAVPTPGQLQQEMNSNTPEQTPAPLPDRPQRVPRELGKPQDELFIDVTAYDVDASAPQALKQALPRLTAPFIGPHRSYEDLVNAAAEVSRFLQSELGFYLGYAYLPEQSPQQGVIRIAVLEGRLDHVELNWTDGLPVDRAVVQGYLDHLMPGSILTVRDVERTVFLINDLRGISVTAEVKAGATPGTAVLVFTPRADPRYSGKVDLDNYGSRYVGEFRVGGTLNWNSPTGRGDGVALSALTSTGGGLNFGLLGYTTPIGSDGWRGGASVSKLRYHLDKNDFPLDVAGTANTYNAFALYPLIRSRNANVFAMAAVDRKEYRDLVSGFGIPRHVDDLVASLTGDFRDSLLTGAVNTFELAASGGRLAFDGGFPSGLDDKPNFRKVDFSFSRLQNVITNRLLLFMTLRGQWAFDNLDTTEQFRAGGQDGVRGFASGEGTGDTGVLLSTELRWLPPEAWFGRWSREVYFAAFSDHAHVRLRHDPNAVLRAASYVNDLGYGSVGLALVWARPNAFSVRFSVAEATYGTPSGDPVQRAPRAYLLGSWYY